MSETCSNTELPRGWFSDLGKLVVLTGAGVSAPSGIPTYRDDDGQWLGSNPILHQDFVADAWSRRRYWARSMIGWSFVQQAEPNNAHLALASLEQQGKLTLLVTQNVDRLHQRAGSNKVVDLHGRLDRVKCLSCTAFTDRSRFQDELLDLNPGKDKRPAEVRPDGDADIEDAWLRGFKVPGCADCGGIMMPDVVFFGGTVPRQRVQRVSRAIEQADALLVAGSSLMVYSGFRFCKLARDLGKPLILINRGRTRADDIATLKLESDCGAQLQELASGQGMETI